MGVLAKYEADFIRRKKLYDKVDLYICPSAFIFRKLQGAGFTKSRMVMMRNPLPMSTRYELSAVGEDYILYFGRLSAEKVIRTLIDAVIKVGCKLEIVGTGPIESELKGQVRQAGAEGIVFRGYQTGQALEDYIKGSRCVVVPSVCYEVGPYTAMEAMALGKPLIASNYGNLPYLVDHEKNGYIYDASSSNSTALLVACIKKMLALPEDKYRQMAQYSLDKAKGVFDAEDYVCRIEKYFMEISGQDGNCRNLDKRFQGLHI